MKSATLPRIETHAADAISSSYQTFRSTVAALHERFAAVLRAKRDERYVMRGEEQLRGPISDEFRRASW